MKGTFSEADPDATAVPVTSINSEAPVSTGNARAFWLTRATVVTALALAMVFTILCLQWSLLRGRLSQDSTYDDCAYLYDGGSRLLIFYERGFGAFLADAARNPPHAPFSTYGASLAFALFGLRDWAPYVLNGLIAGGLLLLIDYLARGLPWRWRAALMALTLTLPIAISTVHDYRPDSICALLSVTGMYLVVEAGAHKTGSALRRALIAGGIAFGLALWAKPPVFALTLITAALATGGAWFAANVFNPRDGNARGRENSALRIGGLVALPCALVAAPYYALNGAEVVHYFISNSFGKSGAFWKVPGGWGSAAHYYLFGEGGELLMGRGFYAWIVVYGLALCWIAWRRCSRELVLQGILLLLTFVSLAVVIYGRIQNPFFGMTWVMLLAVACLRAWAFVISTLEPVRWQRFGAAAAILALGATNMTLLRLRKCWPQHHPAVDALVGRGHSINQRIIDDISRETARRGENPDSPTPMTFLTVTGFINEATLRWLAFRDGRTLAFSDLQRESQFDPFRARIAEADYVVSGEDKTGGVFEMMPPWKLRFQLADFVAGEARAGRLRLLARYPTSEGGSYRLFVNEAKLARATGVFSPLIEEEGFMPFEGPYPQWHIGRVRWAVGPRTQWTFESAAPGAAKLVMWVHSSSDAVHARVLLDGNPIGEIDASAGPEFRRVSLPVALRAGLNRFTLDYSSAPPPSVDGFRRALLFSQLEIQPAP